MPSVCGPQGGGVGGQVGLIVCSFAVNWGRNTFRDVDSVVGDDSDVLQYQYSIVYHSEWCPYRTCRLIPSTHNLRPNQ